eukprot:COSAG06_NODE_4608_length_4103_cov_25.235265_2_plen_446_part_00
MLTKSVGSVLVGYMTLFKQASQALKSVSPRLQIGGPAMYLNGGLSNNTGPPGAAYGVAGTGSGGDYITDFIARCQHSNAEFDFVSMHLYPDDASCWTQDSAIQGTQAHNFGATCWSQQFLKYQGYTKDYSDKPMGCSEYSAGLFNQAYDGVVAAAFLFRNIPLMRDFPWVSFWSVSDVFEEGGMRSREFSEQFGMQTLHGVAKPVFRAFELLRGAGNYTIPVAIDDPTAQGTISAFATVDSAAAAASDGAANTAAALRALRVYVSNYNPMMGLPQNATELTIKLSGLGLGPCGELPGTARVTVEDLEDAAACDSLSDIKATAYVIDATHANPKALWQTSMGQQGGDDYAPSKYLSEAELHTLRVNSEVVPQLLPTAADGAGGLTLQLKVSAAAAAGLPGGSDGAAIMVAFSSPRAERAAARVVAEAALEEAEAAVRAAKAALAAL